MNKADLFLWVAATGLVPIALSYGASPSESMSYLFNIDASGVNSRHIFRAIMGLYLALVIFWVLGARNRSLRLPALWSLVIFMLGLASGRVLSLLVDGIPHPLLLVYLVLELGFGGVGLLLIRKQDSPSTEH